MLYRKTTTAISAVILGVMALLGVTAHAQVDLNAVRSAANPFPTVVFSRESLPRTARVRGDTTTYYETKVPSASQGALTISAALGTLVPSKTPVGRADGLGGVAVRFDLTNLRFGIALTSDSLFVENADRSSNLVTAGDTGRGLRAGGTAAAGSNTQCDGRTCAIFEIDSTSTTVDTPADTLVTLALWNGHLHVAEDGRGTVRVRTYRSYDDALEAGSMGLRADTGARTLVHVLSSVTTRIVPGTAAVADVAADPRFTNFAPAGAKALGSISTILAGHYLADGSGIVTSLGDVMDVENSGIVITDTTQSLGFGTFYLATSAACAGTGAAGVTVSDMGDNAGNGVAGVAAATTAVPARHLCVAPKNSAPATASAAVRAAAPNLEIPATSLMAAVSYAAVTGNAFAATGMTRPVGSIVRNGATVQISYLTVSERVNQRIIITNRSGADAEYELTNFYTEDGTEASAGEEAMGVVPMGSSIVVLTRDAVQFTGSRARGSATLAVTAPAGMISVASTQVNNSDGSTDTINYEVMGAGQ